MRHAEETRCTMHVGHDIVSPARKVDVRLPGKGNSNFHGARPVLPIIAMIEWMQTIRLSIGPDIASPEWWGGYFSI